MRILVLGAYGFIGSEIVRQLLASGHSVVAAGRDTSYGSRLIPAAEWVRADLSHMTSPEQWRPLLNGVGAIVNAPSDGRLVPRGFYGHLPFTS